MGAPLKEGLDYFSINCQFDDKVKLIQAEFGLIGLGILIRLWQKIYGETGYYTAWDDDVALVFADECRVGANVVSEVISACLRRGLFDRQMYDQYGILTSEGIQKRCAAATARRTSKKIDGRYLLISAPKNWVSVYKSPINVDNNSENVDNYGQSKVEYSRGKESKVNTTATIACACAREDGGDDDAEKKTENYVYEAAAESARLRYQNGTLGKGVVLLSTDQFNSLLDTLGIDAFDYYVERLADFILEKNARVKNHYQTILKWYKEDIKV